MAKATTSRRTSAAHAEPQVSRKGDRIEIGDTVRVEAGPALRTAVATDPTTDASSILSDEKTAPHYALGLPDSLGKPIQDGQEFAFLDHFGERVFYVYRKRELNEDDPWYQHKIDPADAGLPDDTTNIVKYQYVFDEVGTYPTEEKAIEAGMKLAAKGA